MSLKNLLGVAGGIFMAVCFLSSVAGAAAAAVQNDFEYSPETFFDPEQLEEVLLSYRRGGGEIGDLEMMEEEEEQRMVEKRGEGHHPNGRCSCSGLSCRCCQFITLRKIGLRTSCCVVVSYFPSAGNIRVSFTIGGRSVYSHDFNVHNIPRICVKVPFLYGAQLCFTFYNIQIGSRSFAACTKLTIYYFFPLGSFNLGCFRMSLINQVGTAHAVDMADTVDMVDTVDMADTVDMTVLKEAGNAKVLLFKAHIPREEIEPGTDDYKDQ